MGGVRSTQCYCIICGKSFGAKSELRIYCSTECLSKRKKNKRVELPNSYQYARKRREQEQRTTLELDGAVLSRGIGDVRERKADCVRVLRCLGAMADAFGADAHLSYAACPINESNVARVRYLAGLDGGVRRSE